MAYTKYHDPWHDADASTGGGNETTPLVAAALDWIEAGIQAGALVADNAAASAASGVSAYNQAPRSAAITSLTAWDVPVWNGSAWVRPSGTATKATFVRGDGAWAQPASAATALPTSPVDGQLTVLTDSLSAPTYTWLLRYNASSASSYKWEFVGGSPQSSAVTAAEATTTSGAFADLTTTGPSVTVAHSGDYEGVYSATFTKDAADGIVQAVIGVGAFTTGELIQSVASIAAAGYYGTSSAVARLNAVAANTELRMRYYQSTAGTLTVQKRALLIRPIRIA